MSQIVRQKSRQSGQSAQANVGYFDRKGAPINVGRWTTLQGNNDYVLVRQYENEKIYITVKWCGKVVGVRDIPREYWKLFKVEVGNVIVAGDRPGTRHLKKIEDPILTKMFATEELALSYYAQLLTERGLLTVEEDYEGVQTVVEVGNLIKQPMMTDVDVAASEPKEVKKRPAAFGAW